MDDVFSQDDIEIISLEEAGLEERFNDTVPGAQREYYDEESDQQLIINRRIRCICGCKGENFTLGDWTAHWRYGKVCYDKGFFGRHPKLRAIKFFLLTRIIFN